MDELNKEICKLAIDDDCLKVIDSPVNIFGGSLRQLGYTHKTAWFLIEWLDCELRSYGLVQ